MKRRLTGCGRHLSRMLRVCRRGGEVEVYRLNVLTLEVDAEGRITGFEVSAFDGEEAGVEYHDGCLMLEEYEPGVFCLWEDLPD